MTVMLAGLSGLAHARAPADDRATTAALNDLDSLSVPATDTTGPRGNPATEWGELICFFAPGLATAAAIGVSGSLVGTFVLLRRDALLALTLPQVVGVGAAVGMRYGWPTLPPAAAAVTAAVAFWAGGRRPNGATHSRLRSDVPAVYVSALCVSFLLIANAGRHVEELQNLFTGIDVAVTPARALTAVPILLVAAITSGLLWRRWLLIAHAPEAARLAGVGVGRWNALFLVLLATVVLVGTDTQGVVLVLAMLFLPPGIVAPWASRIPAALIGGVCGALLCLTIAFYVSVRCEWPLSHSVGGVGAGLLIASRSTRRLVDHVGARKNPGRARV